MPGTLNDVTKQRNERQIAELRAADPDELRRCSETAAKISVSHKLAPLLPGIELIKLLADIEGALIATALRNRRRGGW